MQELIQKVKREEPAFIREVGTGIIFFVLVGVLIGVFVLFGTAINVQTHGIVQQNINDAAIDTNTEFTGAIGPGIVNDLNSTIGAAFETQEETSDLAQLLMLGLGMGVIVAVLLGVTMLGAQGGSGSSRVSF